ncbi:transmembrane protein 47-like [Physella acuta]|uniref:transmembrane protein 47-like n=1 Tax=Physella acuta TaxID=109671 RepID=UPI0027DC8E5D|nr:transmembrane protein 47-like [Physella acuta]XP_059154929.1 transmembrane protein 47-like [Physella acuta]XP_059154930.1 transmembrane protein 47-like [Physella acuta]
MTTYCSVIGLVFLVLTNLAIIITYATPYWLEHRMGWNHGLWARCRSDSCTWLFQENYKIMTNSNVESEWWIATIALTSLGLIFALFSLLLATIALCCECRRCNPSVVIGVLLFMAFLCLSVAAVVFGVCSNKYDNAGIHYTISSGVRFGWSFWLDVAAAGLALLTSLIYCLVGRGKSA